MARSLSAIGYVFFVYIPATALNHAFARAKGPPAATIPPTRLARAHNPTTAPAVLIEIIAPRETSARVSTEVLVLVLVFAMVLVAVMAYLLISFIFFVFTVSVFLCFVLLYLLYSEDHASLENVMISACAKMEMLMGRKIHVKMTHCSVRMT